MSLRDNRAVELWHSFMPQRKHVKNGIDKKLYSIGIYDQHYFKDFNPAKDFVKWAAMEVIDFEFTPNGMSH